MGFPESLEDTPLLTKKTLPSGLAEGCQKSKMCDASYIAGPSGKKLPNFVSLHQHIPS
jgi:hypothetical protein